MPKSKPKPLSVAKKPDQLQVALKELRYAESRLEAAIKRSDALWDEFKIARSDQAAASVDVKRALDKISRVAAREMSKAWRTKKLPSPLKWAVPPPSVPSALKPISITVPLFREDDP